jgi:hypothetical protein
VIPDLLSLTASPPATRRRVTLSCLAGNGSPRSNKVVLPLSPWEFATTRPEVAHHHGDDGGPSDEACESQARADELSAGHTTHPTSSMGPNQQLRTSRDCARHTSGDAGHWRRVLLTAGGRVRCVILIDLSIATRPPSRSGLEGAKVWGLEWSRLGLGLFLSGHSACQSRLQSRRRPTPAPPCPAPATHRSDSAILLPDRARRRHLSSISPPLDDPLLLIAPYTSKS